MDDKYKNEFGVFAERPKVEKKIYDGKYIFLGLIIFFALVTLPLWQNLGKAIPAPVPKLDTPAIQKLAEKDRKCVQPTAFMRANHMQLLDAWRTEVVRGGNRDFVAPGGVKYTASLQNTCLECHSNKAQFCDQCHNYVAVTPTCWGCHLDRTQKLAEAK